MHVSRITALVLAAGLAATPKRRTPWFGSVVAA